VVDPACGSGHFLIAAARRLARHLARARTGDDEPGPEAVRVALRDVVGRCIFGVDINEMAVELCKVALWMETLDPGRPLSFLDANIQCGNSLMGATPALLAGGIPDAAFTPITGDDKAYCTEWKKRNKKEREGQQSLFTGEMNP
jgi:type II restriction/modification system DNA methylase subunit YeeA